MKNNTPAAAAAASPLVIIITTVVMATLAAEAAAAGDKERADALKAINDALSATNSALKAITPLKGTAKALADCADTLGDAVTRMSASSGKLRVKSDAQTWMSAAVTDFTTCNDGLKGANVSSAVSRWIATASTWCLGVEEAVPFLPFQCIGYSCVGSPSSFNICSSPSTNQNQN
ncbi:unnamed protein product [Cuscuta campestris]|uniref:Pectinesterase inhibitor domain-containing protein n=1 Tax=Cuscuta campestris TaxID=132261 RepID=A0A484LNK5_9ASTE|nr:unnamed protein product [Cuscuta campestris]